MKMLDRLDSISSSTGIPTLDRLPSDRLVPPKYAAQMLGVSLSGLWRLEKSDPTFPPRYAVSERRVGWKETDLLAYMESKRVAPTRNVRGPSFLTFH